MPPLFLLGSGASMSVGLPSVEKITEHVLSGDDVVRDNFSRFVVIDAQQRARGEPFGVADIGSVRESVRVVLEGRDLVQQAFDAYGIEQRPTYEDIASVVAQIYESKSSMIPNPALFPLMERAAGRSEPYRMALDYIRGCVSGCVDLKRVKSDPDPGLSYLRDALQAQASRSMCLVTLNHDLVIESALRRWGMAYSDGFGDAVGDGVWFWNDGFDDRRTHLVKLHGSVDWVVGSHPTDLCRGRAPCRSEDFFSPLHEAYDPMFLAGTSNKILQYQHEPYADLFPRFRSGLRSTDRVVVVGYGFGDQAINSYLLQWLHWSCDHRIVVVDPCPGHLEARARPAIKRGWSRWKSDGRLSVLALKAEDVTWRDIQSALA
jgi:SIR2-like domain